MPSNSITGSMQMVGFNKHVGIGFVVGMFATFLPVLFVEISMLNKYGSLIYPVDDTFIHLQLAKNIAIHGNWGINHHEFGSASSSLLYTSLLSFLFVIFSANMMLPLVVNCIAAVVLLYALNIWLSKQLLNLATHLFIVLGVVFFTPLPVMVISGMEHTLQCLFTFLFLFHGVDWISKSREVDIKSWRIPWQIPVYALLVTTTRYEGLFLVGTFCIFLFYFRQFNAAIKIAAASLLPLVIFGIYSLSKGSYFLPNSVLVKSADVSLSGGGPLNFLSTILIEKLTLIKPGITLLATQRLLLILPLTYLIFKKRTNFNFTYALLLLVITVTTLLHLSLASTGKFYRYEAYLMFCAVLVVGTIIGRNAISVYKTTRVADKILALMVTFFLLFPMVLRSTAAFSKAMQACINIYEQQYQMAKFLGEYYPDATVSANDIGAVSYFRPGEVVDLWGLGSMEVTRSRRENYWNTDFLDSISRKKNATMALIYDSWFDSSLGARWTKIGTWQISNNVVCGDDKVSFYAIDSTKANEMKDKFRIFSEQKLPRTVSVTYY